MISAMTNGGTSASAEREMPVVRCEYALLPAPSADLLGSPVSRGAPSQIGKRSLSLGSGDRHAWDSRPTGHYRMGSSFLFAVCSKGFSVRGEHNEISI